MGPTSEQHCPELLQKTGNHAMTFSLIKFQFAVAAAIAAWIRRNQQFWVFTGCIFLELFILVVRFHVAVGFLLSGVNDKVVRCARDLGPSESVHADTETLAPDAKTNHCA